MFNPFDGSNSVIAPNPFVAIAEGIRQAFDSPPPVVREVENTKSTYPDQQDESTVRDPKQRKRK